MKPLGTFGSSDVPAGYGILDYQSPGSGPSSQAVALPDELAAQIVKERSVPVGLQGKNKKLSFFQRLAPKAILSVMIDPDSW